VSAWLSGNAIAREAGDPSLILCQGGKKVLFFSTAPFMTNKKVEFKSNGKTTIKNILHPLKLDK